MLHTEHKLYGHVYTREPLIMDGYLSASVNVHVCVCLYVWLEGEFQLKNKKQSHHCDVAPG